MKREVKLSEYIVEELENIEPSCDEMALERVRKLAMAKAGFEPEQHIEEVEPVTVRRIGKRSIIALVAVLIIVGLFVSALASTELGAQLMDLFREQEYAKVLRDALGLYGSSIERSATDAGVTISIEAAHSTGRDNTLVLSFDDAENRLKEGMSFDFDFHYDGQPEDMPYPYGSGYFFPERSADGKWRTLLTLILDEPVEVKDAQLIVKSIAPSNVVVMHGSTGLTVGEALGKTVPGAEHVKFEDIEMTDEGLIIKTTFPLLEGFHFDDITLRQPDGTLVWSTYTEISGNSFGMSRWVDGVEIPFTPSDIPDDSISCFSSLKDFDQIKDYEILVHYSQGGKAIKGNWTIPFTMPTASEGIPVALDEAFTFNVYRDYHLTGAMIYPACVAVTYTLLDRKQHAFNADGQEPGIFDYTDEDFEQPVFTVLDGGGEVIPHAIDYTNTTWDDNALSLRQEALIRCLTAPHDTITLKVTHPKTGEVYVEETIKDTKKR